MQPRISNKTIAAIRAYTKCNEEPIIKNICIPSHSQCKLFVLSKWVKEPISNSKGLIKVTKWMHHRLASARDLC